MKTADVFPSRFLAADDFDGDLSVTIQKVTLEELGRPGTSEKVQKPCIFFAEFEKPLVLNKTNWLRIAHKYGDDSDGWAGKAIVVGVERVRFGAEEIDAIRVRPGNAPRGATQPVPAMKKPTGDWRAVVIPFGKNAGVPLGGLSPQSLAWYRDEWQPKPHPKSGAVSAQDLQLRAALDASLLEGAPTQEELPQPDADSDVPF